MTKKLIFLVLALTLVGCKDRLDEYLAIRKAYPQAKVSPIKLGNCTGFLIVDTNNVARVVYFPTFDMDDIREVAAILPTDLPAEAP